MDIWSAGFTIYEVIIANFLSENESKSIINHGDYTFTIFNKLELLGDLYRGTRLYEEQGEKNWMIDALKLHGLSQFGTQNWWQKYSGVVLNILNMWSGDYEMPEIAYLLANMLDTDPEKRMSA
uniref:Protein kinase domain-containing protein n=1 Tax=Globodera pallida TaxID=36090 RepID=A0A183C5B7_GLOPA